MCDTNRIWQMGAVAMCTLSLIGCVAPGIRETVLPTRVDYLCTGNKVMKIERARDASAAAVLIDNKPVILPRDKSAAQEKYSDGSYALYLQGERAMLEQNGRVLFGKCSAGPLPKTMNPGFTGN